MLESGGVTMVLMLWAFYLNLSFGDLTNTSSHIYDSWYLPIFLFQEGSFILINVASLMVLAMLWSSLPTILKFSRDNSWPSIVWMNIFLYTWWSLCWRWGKSLCQRIKLILLMRKLDLSVIYKVIKQNEKHTCKNDADSDVTLVFCM